MILAVSPLDFCLGIVIWYGGSLVITQTPTRSYPMSTTKNQPAWKSVADLQKLSLEELRDESERVTGKKTKSRNRKQLFRGCL